MAKKRKIEKAPREMTRRQLSHHRKQQRRQRFILFGGIGVIAAIVLVVLVGWLATDYIPLHRTVIKVNDVKFSAGDFVGYLEISALTQQSSGQTPNLGALAVSAADQMPNNELMRAAAEQLGITVSDKDAGELLKKAGLPVNGGSIVFARTSLLQNKLKSAYFGVVVPESDNQVWSNVMLLESGVQAAEIRGRLELGENFTALAPEYALNYYSKNMNKGDFGWHPYEVLWDQLGSDIPTDYAFSAEVGTLSKPLDDPLIYKQLGYWLIKVLNEPSNESANVSALFVSSRVLAEELKPQLENTDNISAIAANYNQYSKEKHGELGLVNRASMTEAFNGYVFSDNVVIGGWSQPVRDDSLWTQGGSWLVKVIDRAADREISDEDRDYLIGKRFEEWLADLEETSAGAVDTAGLTEEVKLWAIERVARSLEKFQG